MALSIFVLIIYHNLIVLTAILKIFKQTLFVLNIFLIKFAAFNQKSFRSYNFILLFNLLNH